MDLVSCAAAYSLTDSLVSQIATVAPTASPSYTPTTISAEATPTYTPIYSYSSKTYDPTPVSNVTYTPTNTAGGVEFTGGAAQAVAGGLKGLALAAGALLAL